MYRKKVKTLPWDEVYSYHEIQFNNRLIVLSHYPIESWKCSNYGSIHLHGHCHGKLKHIIKNRYDAGVDCNQFVPKTLGQILTGQL